MKNLLMICLIACVSTSCAIAPNPWNEIKVPDSEIAYPIVLPDFPDPISSTKTTATYSRDSIEDMVLYVTAADANTKAATANAEQIEDLREGAESLVEAGKSQRQIADMKQTMLDNERKHNFFTNIGLYVVIIGLAL